MSQPEDRSESVHTEVQDTTQPKSPGGEPVGSKAGSSQPSSSQARNWTIILTAGLLSGLTAFAIGEQAPVIIPASRNVPMEQRKDRNLVPIQGERQVMIARDRVAALTYCGLGMLLSWALGAAGGLVRRSPRAAIWASVVGLVLGATAGAGATLSLLPSYHAARAAASEQQVNDDLVLALQTHGGIWLAIGLTGGLALGLGLGGMARIARAVIGGAVGAVLATLTYEFAGALFFPVAETFRPVAATFPPRLLAHLLIALFVSVGAFWAAEYLTLYRGSRPAVH
jgi:hypothetical protein